MVISYSTFSDETIRKNIAYNVKCDAINAVHIFRNRAVSLLLAEKSNEQKTLHNCW